MSDSSGTPRTAALQVPLSMGFPRQEYWSGLPFPSPGGLPGLGIEPMSPALAGEFFTREPLEKPICPYTTYINAPKAEKRKNHNRDEGEVYKVYQGRPIRAERSLGT